MPFPGMSTSLGNAALARRSAEQGRPSTIPILNLPSQVGNFLRDLGGQTVTRGVSNIPRDVNNPRWLGGAGGGNAGASRPSTAGPSASAPARQGGGGYIPAHVSDPSYGGAPTPIVTGQRGGLTDLRQGDMYRQYAQNPQGQYDRYFHSPEMDQYFGSASRGAGAPTSAAAMMQMAGQPSPPPGTAASTFYRAESATGRANMEDIVAGMGYKGTPLESWAQANPMLAQREFAKRFGGSQVSPQGLPQGIPGINTNKMMPTPDMRNSQFPNSEWQGPAFGAESGVDISKMMPTQEMGQHSFGTPANSVPAPPQVQGAAVSAPYAAAAQQASQKTTGEGMPAFRTTNPGDLFLQSYGKKYPNLFNAPQQGGMGSITGTAE